MMSVEEAFDKFRSNLEVRPTEEADASRRANEIREVMRGSFALERDILTGSYKRATKTRPLKDVDIFCIFDPRKESARRSSQPSRLLEAVQDALLRNYSRPSLSIGRRSVSLEFERPSSSDPERVISFDVVPAFPLASYYEIPDRLGSVPWVKTDPEVHADKAKAANEAFSNAWKPLVKMLKKWNETQGKPIKPSFLIEVMALQLFRPPFSGGFARELKGFFASAALRIGDPWPDPAGLGPLVSDQMDPAAVESARRALRTAEANMDHALHLARDGSVGQALRLWRDSMFGDFFPLS